MLTEANGPQWDTESWISWTFGLMQQGSSYVLILSPMILILGPCDPTWDCLILRQRKSSKGAECLQEQVFWYCGIPGSSELWCPSLVDLLSYQVGWACCSSWQRSSIRWITTLFEALTRLTPTLCGSGDDKAMTSPLSFGHCMLQNSGALKVNLRFLWHKSNPSGLFSPLLHCFEVCKHPKFHIWDQTRSQSWLLSLCNKNSTVEFPISNWTAESPADIRDLFMDRASDQELEGPTGN